MLCPKCSSLDDKVIDSRLCKEGESIRRRRECLSCHHRFTTYEEIERMELLIVKRDGRREAFDRQKLLASFIKACEKRAIPLEAIEHSMTSVLQHLYSLYQQEISTRLIGDQVMERLRQLDPIAYVRYASVYRRFEEVREFIQEIQLLKETGVSPSTEPLPNYAASTTEREMATLQGEDSHDRGGRVNTRTAEHDTPLAALSKSSVSA